MRLGNADNTVFYAVGFVFKHKFLLTSDLFDDQQIF
jgi:hypothetical protein